MPVDTLTLPAALVLIDLQKGVTAMPLVHPAADVLARSAELAAAFRARELPVVRVRVAWSPDRGDALKTPVDAAPASAAGAVPGPEFSELCPEIGDGATDLHIVKRQWDAFYGTELDLQLRRRGMTTVVYAGIATSIGVESTARHGRELGYEQVIASDAVTDMVAGAHENAMTNIFPRLARVDSTAAIVAALV
jgi:nicotinamidase-related amidase